MNKRAKSIAVFVSVLVNILLIGIVFGHIYSGKGRPHHGSYVKEMRQVLATLPNDKAQWYANAMKVSKEQRREHYKTIKKLRREAVDILIAEQFDVAAFEQKLLQLDQLGGDIKRQQMNIIIEFASQLTAEERRSLSEFLLMDRGFRKKH
jgi:uncharacterized membrane protein